MIGCNVEQMMLEECTVCVLGVWGMGESCIYYIVGIKCSYFVMKSCYLDLVGALPKTPEDIFCLVTRAR